MICVQEESSDVLSTTELCKLPVLQELLSWAGWLAGWHLILSSEHLLHLEQLWVPSSAYRDLK